MRCTHLDLVGEVQADRLTLAFVEQQRADGFECDRETHLECCRHGFIHARRQPRARRSNADSLHHVMGLLGRQPPPTTPKC
jgi:hypothetical protein